MEELPVEEVLRTLARATPKMELTHRRAGAVSGNRVVGFHHQELAEASVEPPESVVAGFSGPLRVLSKVTQAGCAIDETPRAEPGLLREVGSDDGLGFATDHRLVGMSQTRLASPGQELLWEIPYDRVTAVTMTRKGSRITGFAVLATLGGSEGAIAIKHANQLDTKGRPGRRIKDFDQFVSPIVTAIFDHRAATNDDHAYLAQLQQARSSGWQQDPDFPDDLRVSLPILGEPFEPVTLSTTTETPVVVADEPREPAAATDGIATADEAVQLPVAGWHTDPHDPSLYRYWDGAQWTEHTAPKSN